MTEGYNTFEFVERAYIELALCDVEQAPRRDGVLFVSQRMNHARSSEAAFVGTAEALTEALALFAALSSEGMMDVVVRHARGGRRTSATWSGPRRSCRWTYASRR